MKVGELKAQLFMSNSNYETLRRKFEQLERMFNLLSSQHSALTAQYEVERLNHKSLKRLVRKQRDEYEASRSEMSTKYQDQQQQIDELKSQMLMLFTLQPHSFNIMRPSKRDSFEPTVTSSSKTSQTSCR